VTYFVPCPDPEARDYIDAREKGTPKVILTEK